MTQRQQQILKIAIEMMADEGYASLTMRALARACGMKLGALQYHFRTTDDMFKSLIQYIGASYQRAFSDFEAAHDHQVLSVSHVVDFIVEDTAGEAFLSDRLWPQLWAMQQVEPLVSDLVEDIYSQYIVALEKALETTSCKSPKSEALLLMSLLEGATLFLGEGRRWESESESFRQTVRDFIKTRYGT